MPQATEIHFPPLWRLVVGIRVQYGLALGRTLCWASHIWILPMSAFERGLRDLSGFSVLPPSLPPFCINISSHSWGLHFSWLSTSPKCRSPNFIILLLRYGEIQCFACTNGYVPLWLEKPIKRQASNHISDFSEGRHTCHDILPWMESSWGNHACGEGILYKD